MVDDVDCFCYLQHDNGVFKTTCGIEFDYEPLLIGYHADAIPKCDFCGKPIYQSKLQ